MARKPSDEDSKVDVESDEDYLKRIERDPAQPVETARDQDPLRNPRDRDP